MGFSWWWQNRLEFSKEYFGEQFLKVQFCLCGKHLNNILALFIPFVQLDIFMVVKRFFMDQSANKELLFLRVKLVSLPSKQGQPKLV